MDLDHLVRAVVAPIFVVLVSILIATKSTRLGNKSRFHLRRMLFHVTIGLTCAAVGQYFIPPFLCTYVLTTSIIVFYVLHQIRLISPPFNARFNRLFSFLLRPSEFDSLPTAFYFLIGMNIAITFFDADIAILSILFLAIGDPTASLFGTWLASGDSIRFSNGKTVIGALANFTACSITGILYLRSTHSQTYMIYSVIGALAASLSELITLPGVDDNLAIPLTSALALTALRRLLPVK
uniref:Dolichol kinase n=1 Tax=Spongospora subterranea TaxID=70186 RepID=A0A0H5QWP8_9EUKA|eukprot:CRZ06056.1 hypothetical protein [Spongospora subterranea]